MGLESSRSFSEDNVCVCALSIGRVTSEANCSHIGLKVELNLGRVSIGTSIVTLEQKLEDLVFLRVPVRLGMSDNLTSSWLLAMHQYTII